MKEAVQKHHHEAALNSLLSASLHILANMVSVQPSRQSPDEIDVVISFRSQSSDVVFLSADVTNWTPEQMSWNGDSHEHVITVPRGTQAMYDDFLHLAIAINLRLLILILASTNSASETANGSTMAP
jgi:hypothetical protein